MKKIDEIGVQVPKVFLPREGIDLTKWSVVACDQYTSQPEYWEELYRYVGDSPSTLHLILPEAFLEAEDIDQRIQKIHQTMIEYLQKGILEELEGLIYVERVLSNGIRKGLLVALDLEKYDFRAGSTSIIRATEATLVERIPPRLKIRNEATLELPHIMILIDDEKKEVIEPIADNKKALLQLYDFPLNMGGGELRGYVIKDPILENTVMQALGRLVEDKTFHEKYHLDNTYSPLIFAVGDGNHSMATAKTYWEKIKPTVAPNHPARYALVELVNLYDEGLIFEPIHRLLINSKVDIIKEAEKYFSNLTIDHFDDHETMIRKVKETAHKFQSNYACFGFIAERKICCLTVKDQADSLDVTVLQNFVEHGLQEKWFEKVDYVHGDDVIIELASKPNYAGFFLPPIDKKCLFKTVLVEGSLPKKAFSMGHAHEKRYYLEARKIR